MTAYEMRISDWSADVCSSDLNLIAAILLSAAILIGWNFIADKYFPTPAKPDVTTTVAGAAGAGPAAQPAGVPAAGSADRKSVVEGKSVSVRVDLGGRRTLKTKKI